MSALVKFSLEIFISIFFKFICLNNINAMNKNITNRPIKRIKFLFMNKKKFKLTRQS